MNFENFNKSDKTKWVFIIIAFVAEAICIVINFNQLNKLKENNAAVAKYHAAVESLKDETVKSIPFTGIPTTVDTNVEQAKKLPEVQSLSQNTMNLLAMTKQFLWMYLI